MSKWKLFLAHSFAESKVDALGAEDRAGISDRELADKVAEWISEFSGGAIDVIRTKDPFHSYIPTAVYQDISRADFVVCLFTGRVKDHYTRRWVPSTYVVSEASLAFGQMSTDAERLRRLHCLVEDRVDETQLGLAFHSSQTRHKFNRDNLNSLREKVHGIVQAILGTGTSGPPSREYLAMNKSVTVYRNGAVVVETRHHFRFREETRNVRIPHTMWRISQSLPSLNELLRYGDLDSPGFLCCSSIAEPERPCRIAPGRTSNDGREHTFHVEIPGVTFHPGDELKYAIAWGYPDAFSGAPHTQCPNTAGLRTGGRGMANRVSFTIAFEADFEHRGRVVEQNPELQVTSQTTMPTAEDPKCYWHNECNWEKKEVLRRCDSSGAVNEVYRWDAQSFLGTAKVEWNPHLNYFQPQTGIATRLMKQPHKDHDEA